MSRTKKLPATIDKICPVCSNTFTISYYLRNKRTYCSKKCSNNDLEMIKKKNASQEKTFEKKYGGHPMKTERTKENLKAAVKKKYGVEWISSSEGWYEKVKKNNLETHGIENYNNIEQIKKTNLERYGVDCVTKSKLIMDNISETKRKNHYEYLLKFSDENNIEMLFTYDEYQGYHFSNIYKFKCKKCNYIFNSLVYNLNSLFCEKCNPNKKDTLENSFFDFLSSLTPMIIKRRDRTILYGKELDFYLPEKKIAFEINGLYWHSENGTGILKNYHLNKTKGCFAHGIRLIHIFENEWRDKPDLIKSIIRTILKCNTDKVIYARNCELKEVDAKEKNDFLNKNHIQQEDKSTVKLGLYSDDKLVSLMTFNKKSRFDTKIEWELSRFCNLQDTLVIGGASKIFSYFLKTYLPKSIVSYCDRRYFSGEIYNILGFRFVNNTTPSYHYITPDYKNTINRMNFQKHLLSKKLINFNSELSEWENMKENGYDRIWDCGHSKWVWNIH